MTFSIRKLLPNIISAPLWGNRKKWGLEIDYLDPCWKQWEKTYTSFYSSNQRSGVGAKINDAGYKVMSSIDLSGKRVLEVGAGDIRHLKYLNGKPKEYILADISNEMTELAQKKLKENHVEYKTILLERNEALPLEDGSIDVIISFYSLEHLNPLNWYLKDMRRVLKENGSLIGAVPAEGGLAWGLGRFFTSRRWLKKNSSIDPDKIICWEHPNFADDIVRNLDDFFHRKSLIYWPFGWLKLFDFNLVIQFNFTKKSVTKTECNE